MEPYPSFTLSSQTHIHNTYSSLKPLCLLSLVVCLAATPAGCRSQVSGHTPAHPHPNPLIPTHPSSLINLLFTLSKCRPVTTITWWRRAEAVTTSSPPQAALWWVVSVDVRAGELERERERDRAKREEDTGEREREREREMEGDCRRRETRRWRSTAPIRFEPAAAFFFRFVSAVLLGDDRQGGGGAAQMAVDGSDDGEVLVQDLVFRLVNFGPQSVRVRFVTGAERENLREIEREPEGKRERDECPVTLLAMVTKISGELPLAAFYPFIYTLGKDACAKYPSSLWFTDSHPYNPKIIFIVESYWFEKVSISLNTEIWRLQIGF
ncbi:hypothetical protein HanXRQr2_Chr05g0208611 [Helianthus annuus]|uniref:Uncharacterized protein n=1 Tax=Helianthus annuus TaxID=4232 RepID=A0A9K3IYV0_HELAN|nr:hypothetical protein HanXRQr2_Chr05g0208611 [Helianthus annuus]KAJ0922257.1 hypothetical protein HanPSC8_Chr05g0201601 [Helianthus annuus]